MTRHTSPARAPRGLALLTVVACVAAAVVVSMLGTAWWMHRYLYAPPFEPTQLAPKEEAVLAAKLERLPGVSARGLRERRGPRDEPPVLEPEPYREDDAQRRIRLSERELNAVIARDPYTARRVAVDLSDDLVSVQMLIPLDPAFPVLGGTTVRLSFGLELGFAAGRPVVAIRGITLGGVPIPGAWWGGIKNVNLVEEFGDEGGFWDQFARGVESLAVRDGRFEIQLRE